MKAPFILALAATLAIAPAAYAAEKDRIVVGWVENVHIGALDSEYKAKLDTGATTSSIDANIISLNEDDKPKRVVFSMVDEDGKSQTLERDIVRFVRIKKKGSGNIRRPVVKMTFCIAGKPVTEEVNLANRENFIYPVLIGRNMLKKGKLVIDSTRTFTSDAECGEAEVKASNS